MAIFLNAFFFWTKDDKADKQGKVVHSKEQNKSSETSSKGTKDLDLPEKAFKTTALNMLNKLKEEIEI